jgi:hypothetical protein
MFITVFTNLNIETGKPITTSMSIDSFVDSQKCTTESLLMPKFYTTMSRKDQLQFPNFISSLRK